VEPRLTERSSHYSRHPLESTGDTLTPRRVRATTVDRIIGDHAFPEPFGLKIDTEGAELEVIRGAAATLERGCGMASASPPALWRRATCSSC